MKHPFYTLYYTGLAFLVFFLLFSGLLISNLSNILDLIPKKQTDKINTDVVKNHTVLETQTPKTFVELDNPKVEKKDENKNLTPQTNTQSIDTTTKIIESAESVPLNTNDTTNKKDTNPVIL